MNSKEAIKKIRVMLGMEKEETKLAEQKLKDGSTIYFTELVEGQVITIEKDGEQVPAPAGEYILEDETILIVEDEGIIKEVKEPEEEELEEEPKEEVETQEEVPAEAPEELPEMTMEQLMERVKMLEEAFAELLNSYESFSTDLEKNYETFSKDIEKKVEEIGEQPSTETVKLEKEKIKDPERWEQRMEAIRNLRKNK